jgi:hypothetical protein
MKLKTLAAALAICLLCCSAFSMTAFAAENNTSATTSVLYTVQGGYTVNIPASVNLNSNETVQISAPELTLPVGKNLVVRLSSDSFDETGAFYLTNAGSSEQIPVEICRAHYDGGQSAFLRASECLYNPEVAIFDNTSMQEEGGYIPTTYGQLSFVLGDVTGVVAGDYTGQLHFTIGLEDQ